MHRCALLRLLCFLAVPACIAAGPVSPVPSPAAPAALAAACAAERDRRLAAIAQEEQSLKLMFDAEAAAVDAPEFRLRKAEQALMRELQTEMAAAHARFRDCRRRAGAG